MKKWMLLGAGLWLVGCGPQGQIASPEQNVAERFVVKEGFRQSWNWTVPGAPAVLSLAADGPHEMLWTVSDKDMPDVRRSRIASLQTATRFFSQGPSGVKEVRFSPSGKTILAYEFSRDGSRFQTVLFQNDLRTGAWRSRYLSLGEEAKTKTRKLDDRSKVPGLLEPAIAPKILRLDENLVIYEVEGKTRSLEL